MQPSEVAVVVVNYGSSALIRRNLAPLVGVPGCRVIVVDNHTTAEERDRVSRLCAEHHWTAVLLDTNTGFGGGVNAGLARAGELGVDSYLLLNPDAVIDAGTVAELAAHVRQNRSDLVTPRIIRPDGSTWTEGFAVDLKTGRMRSRPGLSDLRSSEAPWLTGACLALSADLLDRVGGMPDGYFLYWEDVDFSMRVLSAGGSLVVRDDLVVVHDEGGTQRDDDRAAAVRPLSDRYYFYNCRNRLLFAARFLDRRGLRSWIAATPRQSWLILLRGGRRQLLHSPRPLAAAVGGSVAGLTIAARALLRRGAGDPNPAPAVTAAPVG